jgi:hypothetical protein
VALSLESSLTMPNVSMRNKKAALKGHCGENVLKHEFIAFIASRGYHKFIHVKAEHLYRVFEVVGACKLLY